MVIGVSVNHKELSMDGKSGPSRSGIDQAMTGRRSYGV